MRRSKPNTFITDGKTALMELNQGKAALVDAADIPLIQNYHWTYRNIKGIDFVTYATKDGEFMTLGRFLLGAVSVKIDAVHMNYDRLDFRRSNLKMLPTYTTMSRKKKQIGPSTSRFKGVCMVKGKWRAKIQVNGVAHEIGNFDDEIEAAKAYNRMALTLIGPLARINDLEGI